MYQWISVTKLQELAAGVRESRKWNPWSRRNYESPRKPTDAHKLLATFTDASRNLHVTAGQIFYDLLGTGVSSSGLHIQENKASTNNSNIKIVTSAALLQLAARALLDTTGYQLRLC